MRVTDVLLASEGRAFSPAVISKAAELAGKNGKIHVLSIARIYGVAFGFPNPWLLPSKQEWAAQRSIVADAIAALERLGIDAKGAVIGARNATKRINAEATRLKCDAIIMGADTRQGRLLTDLKWSHEPYRVMKKAKLPVHLVVA
jgi:nucleotide-binding universal stress UspA family protein